MTRPPRCMSWYEEDWAITTAICLAVLFAVAAFTVGAIFAAKQFYLEPGCDQEAAQLRVPAGDYRFQSDTCWLTLENGTHIPADRYRVTDRGGLR